MPESTTDASTRRRDLVWAGALVAACFALFLASPVEQVGDSHFTLLLADQLLTQRTFDLAPRIAKGVDPGPTIKDGLPEQLESVGPHVYYDSSPASASVSAPFVPLLKAMGLRFAHADGGYDASAETRGQSQLAALLMAAAAGVFFAIARTLLPRPTSLLVALGGALGTPVWSTASRALWSHTWGLLFASLGLLVLLRAQAGIGRWRPFVLGTLWAAAYLVRPTLAIPLAAVGALLLWQRPRAIPPFALGVGVWVLALVAYARTLYGRWLPPYFAPGDLSLDGAPAAALGSWFSPSRGLVPYVPAVLFVAYASYRYPPRAALRPLRLMALVVIAVHTLVLSTNPLWWGGHCYGPRYMTDVVPWLVLLAVLAADGHREAGNERWTPLERASALVLLALAIGIHARGAFAPATQEWNYRPRSVDVATERLWDWRRPQALAGWVSLSDPDGAPALPLDQMVDLRLPESEAYLGEGWSVGEPAQRWALGPAARLGFGLAGTSDVVLRLDAEPFLVAGRLAEQAVGVDLNGHPVGSWRLRYTGFRTYSVRLPRSLQAPQDRVRLRFPDAASPRSLGQGDDRRRLGLAVRTLRAEALPLLARGQPVTFAGEGAAAFLGAGWGEPEALHRWTEGPQSEVWFAAHDQRPAVLRLALSPFLSPGHRDRQRVRVELNGWIAADLELTEGAVQQVAAVLPSGALADDNLLRLHLPDAPTTPPADPHVDPRPLGVAVRTLTIEDLPAYPAGGTIDPQSAEADAFLIDGWAWEDASHPSLRWALGPRARLAFALEAPVARVMRLDLTPFLAPALATQRVELALNGVRLADLELRSDERDEYPIALPPGVLARHNVLAIELPAARSPQSLGLGGDARRLGVIVHGVRLE